MGNNPTPKLDAQRAMRLENFEHHRGTTRERASTSVRGPLCDFKQARTGLTCLKELMHRGHHRFVPEVVEDTEV